MKKHSLLVLLLSSLLCLAMLLASCARVANNTGDDDGTRADDNEPETEVNTETNTETNTEANTEREPNPVDESVDYGKYIEQWTKYIEYNDTKDDSKLNASLIYNSDSDMKKYRESDAWIVLYETDIRYDFDGSKEQKSYYVYSLVTGEQMASFKTDYYSTVGSPKETIEIRELGDDSGFFKVIEGTYKNFGTEEEPDYQYEYTYSYFDANGTKVAGDLKEPSDSVQTTSSGAEIVTICDKCYLCRDSQIVYTFDKGQERDIPNITPNARFDRDDYRYYASYNRLTVFDNKYNVVCSVKLDNEHDLSKWWVLDSGDVLIQYADYDRADGDGKIILQHIIAHVDDGKIEEIENPEYYITDVVTQYNRNYTYKIKDGKECQLVSAREINSECDDDIKYLIMDNSLKTVAELPSIIKNQVEFDGFISQNKMIITAANYDGSQDISYAVDTNNSTVSLYIDRSSSQYEEVEGGFIYNGILYDTNMNTLCDLRYVEGYSVWNGKVIAVREKLLNENDIMTDDDESDTVIHKYSTSIYYISNGRVQKNFVCYDTAGWQRNGQLILVSDNNDYEYNRVYNCYGEYLVSADSVSVDGNVIKCTDKFGSIDDGDVFYRYKYYILK